MAITTIVKATDSQGREVNLRGTEGGVPYYSDVRVYWTSKGYGFQAMATAAVASLVVRPTTVAQITLYNNSANKNYVIDRVMGHNLVGAAQCVSTLWLCVHPVGMTAPTNDITVRNSLNGKIAGGTGIFDVAATVVDNGWFPWGRDTTTVTVTTPGGALDADVSGRIIIPPTAALSATVVSSVTGSTWCLGCIWYEVPETELVLY